MSPDIANSGACKINVKIIVVELLNESVFWFQKNNVNPFEQVLNSSIVLFKEMDARKYMTIQQDQNLIANARSQQN